MKTKTILISLISLLFLNVLIFQACDKEDEPNKSPGCEITSPADGEKCVQNEIVTITVAANDSDGTISEVRFFIDGVSIGTESTSPYNYDWNTQGETLGNHTIKATSIDNEGANTSDEVTVEVIKGDGSDFTANPTSGNAPLTVNFTDQSTNNPTSWLWDFGDGNNSTEQNPSHIYIDMGSYDVTLTVTNQNGSAKETKTNYIIVTDVFIDTRDGQTYNIVTIGNQTWFAENLNYETADSWWYQDDETNGNEWGRLYLWDASINACPNGWHLPSDDEWKSLEMYMGMSQSEVDNRDLRGTDEGQKLKSADGWNADGNGIDAVGFKALPGGMRNNNGFFAYKDSYGSWWTSTEDLAQTQQKYYRFLESSEDQVGRNTYHSIAGLSVRCIKND